MYYPIGEIQNLFIREAQHPKITLLYKTLTRAVFCLGILMHFSVNLYH